MSSSHDSSCSLHLVDSHGKKKGCMFRVRKGVTTFDYSKEWNIIGTSITRRKLILMIFSLLLFHLSP